MPLHSLVQEEGQGLAIWAILPPLGEVANEIFGSNVRLLGVHAHEIIENEKTRGWAIARPKMQVERRRIIFPEVT